MKGLVRSRIHRFPLLWSKSTFLIVFCPFALLSFKSTLSFAMNPSEQNLKKDLQQLQSLLYDSPVIDFPSLKFMLDDEFLLQFYRGRKYNIKAAFDSICNYINRRLAYTQIMKDMTPFKIALLNSGMSRCLMHTDHKDGTIIFFTPGKANPEKFTVSDMLRDALLTIDDVLRSSISACEKGVVVVIDCTDVTFAHIRQVTPSFAKAAMNLLVNSVPLQFKGIHIIYETMILRGVIRLFKQFLPMKIRKRIHLHSDDIEKLHTHISPNRLPESLGGSLSEDDAYDNQRVIRIRNREHQYARFAGRHRESETLMGYSTDEIVGFHF